MVKICETCGEKEDFIEFGETSDGEPICSECEQNRDEEDFF